MNQNPIPSHLVGWENSKLFLFYLNWCWSWRFLVWCKSYLWWVSWTYDAVMCAKAMMSLFPHIYVSLFPPWILFSLPNSNPFLHSPPRSSLLRYHPSLFLSHLFHSLSPRFLLFLSWYLYHCHAFMQFLCLIIVMCIL